MLVYPILPCAGKNTLPRQIFKTHFFSVFHISTKQNTTIKSDPWQNTTIKSDPWNTRLQKEIAKYQIKKEEMVKCRAIGIKQKVKHKIKVYSNKQMMEATERKSKLKHLVETSYDNTLNMRKQQPYMNTNAKPRKARHKRTIAHP